LPEAVKKRLWVISFFRLIVLIHCPVVRSAWRDGPGREMNNHIAGFAAEHSDFHGKDFTAM
jgi:hypothetical protein